MTTPTPPNPNYLWPADIADVHAAAAELAKEMEEPATSRQLREDPSTSLDPMPSLIIPSAEGVTTFGSLPPEEQAILDESMGDIFDEHAAQRRRAAIRIASDNAGIIADAIVERLN